MADYQGRARRLGNADKTWGASIDRESIDLRDAAICDPHGGFIGKTVEITTQSGKSWTKRIKAVDDISDKYVRVYVEDIPDGEEVREPGDEERIVTEANLTKWFRALMKDLRANDVDVEPVKAAMGRCTIKWETR